MTPAPQVSDDEMTHVLARVRRASGVSVAFGGPVDDSGVLRLQNFCGSTTGALPGTVLPVHQGLGGKAVALKRSLAVDDYFGSDRITHTYDREVRAEGIRSVVAMPIVVAGRAVAIVYGAFRGPEVIGGRVQDAMAREVRAFERDRPGRTAVDNGAGFGDEARLRERLRDAHAQLRVLSQNVGHAETRSVLERITRDLAEIDSVATEPTIMTPLTSRDVDVVTLAAAGLSNRRIADTLGLSPHTVKSYMQTVMAKLGASTRLEAVVVARRAGIIP